MNCSAEAVPVGASNTFVLLDHHERARVRARVHSQQVRACVVHMRHASAHARTHTPACLRPFRIVGDSSSKLPQWLKTSAVRRRNGYGLHASCGTLPELPTNALCMQMADRLAMGWRMLATTCPVEGCNVRGCAHCRYTARTLT